jgi:putative ABC transport system permease protein
MSFNQIAFKIFRENFKRYVLFFLCCSYTITVFFIFSTIYTNSKFMNSMQNGNIASNIIAPSLGVAIFSVFFITYAYLSFIKFRKREFGLFMILGMTNLDIIKMMIFESSLLAALSLAAGLIAGTLLSPLFYLLVFKLNNIEGITFGYSFLSYLYTTLFFLAIFVLIILCSIITSMRYKIVNLIKQDRVNDSNLLSKPIWFVIGIFIIGLSFFDMIHNYNNNAYVFLRSFCFCFAGIYFCISSMISFFSFLFNGSKKYKYRYMLFIADLKYTLGQTKKILFVITLLAGITIFFLNLSLLLMTQAQRVALSYNPYDIAYLQVNGMNNISDKALNDIVTKGATPLTAKKTLPFVQTRYFIFISDHDVNTVLGCNYSVQKGHFICLFPIVTDDGYEHITQGPISLDVTTGSGQQTYAAQGNAVKVLFNRFNIFSDSQIVIVNNSDYVNIKAGSKPENIGLIKLMNFKNWRDTKNANDKLNAAFMKNNRLNTKLDLTNQDNVNYLSYISSTASKIGDYTNLMQSASFMLFLCSFVGILFFVSSGIILHFKLLMGFEGEKIKYRKINKIGITKDEVSKMIAQELKVLFFLPIILSILIAAFYSAFFSVEHWKGAIAIIYCLCIGVIYLIVQLLYYLIYKRIYTKKLLTAL